jgi:hypothetical protein
MAPIPGGDRHFRSGADGNKIVNAADFLAFRSSSATVDVNNDGVVDGTDFLRFRLNFLAMVRGVSSPRGRRLRRRRG